MAFTLPKFNLIFKVWTGGHTPNGGPNDVADIPGQLYLNTRGLLDIQPGQLTLWVPPLYVRIPLGVYSPVVGDIFAHDAIAFDFYRARWVQRAHIGFTNEYIAVLVEQCDGNGTTPRP